MFKKINWKYTFISAFIAAFLFCICAFIFINKADYTVSWILYLGSVMFFFTMAITTVKENRKRGGDESTVSLVFASLVTTFVGIIISVITCFILLMIMDKGFIFPGTATKVLQEAPPASIQGKTGGLAFKVFFAATVLCLFGGSIASVTLPFYTKRNQTKQSEPHG